jgi:hypothetical protein
VPDAGLHATLAVRRVFQFSHSPLFLASHIATCGEVLIQDANYPHCSKGQVEAVSGLIPLAMLGSRIRSVGRSLGVAEAYPQREPRALSSCGSLLAAVPAFAKPNLHVVGQMPRNQLYSVDGLVSEALPASTFPGARTWPTVSFVRHPTTGNPCAAHLMHSGRNRRGSPSWESVPTVDHLLRSAFWLAGGMRRG